MSLTVPKPLLPLILALTGLRPARSATPVFDVSDCAQLGLVSYGELRTLEEWSATSRDYSASAHASRLVRIYRRARGGEVGELVGRPGLRLCHGDRVELWHDARAIVDQRYTDEGGAVTVRTLRAEGGAVIQLGDTIRQFRGAATYFSWDDFLLEDDGRPKLVQVGDSLAGIASAKSTFRLEVEDSCACKVRLAVSDRSDPLSETERSDDHGVLFVGFDARGQRFMEEVSAGEAVAINLAPPDEPRAPSVVPLPEPEAVVMVAEMNEAHEALVASLRATKRRPPPEAYQSMMDATLLVVVTGDAAPTALRVDGQPVVAPLWQARSGGWTAQVRVTLGLGEHEVALVVPGVEIDAVRVTVTRGETSLRVRFVAPPMPATPKPETASAPPKPVPPKQEAGGPTGETWTTSAIPGAQMTFVELEGGRFHMGSPDGVGDSDEHPVHAVPVKGFWMGQAEVTQAQWMRVVRVAKAAGDTRAAGLKDDPSSYKGASRPVERVSWCDAVRFANALSRLEGLVPAYTVGADCERGGAVWWDRSASGFRLPTEAEWEYAARAGTRTAYATGDTEADLARAGWYGGTMGSQTHPVCTAAAKPWGLCDLHGNVWEWVWDKYARYKSSKVSSPVEPRRGGSRVLRGGSWFNPAEFARSANRDRNRPSYAWFYIGFRLVLPAAPSER